MPEVADMRAALADNLSVIPDVQISPYMLANPTPPAIHVLPGPVEYSQAFRAGAEWWEFRIQAFVASVQDIGSQRRLDGMLDSDGPLSVYAALNTDDTLGGLCDDLIVVSRSGYQQYVLEGRGTVMGAEWIVRVFI